MLLKNAQRIFSLVWGTLYLYFSSLRAICQAHSFGYTDLTHGAYPKLVIPYLLLGFPEGGSHFFSPLPLMTHFLNHKAALIWTMSTVMLCCGFSL